MLGHGYGEEGVFIGCRDFTYRESESRPALSVAPVDDGDAAMYAFSCAIAAWDVVIGS